MNRQNHNLLSFRMIKKNIIFFLLLILLNNCSFDSKTGIWGDAEKERKRISKLEKDQKEIIKIEFFQLLFRYHHAVQVFLKIMRLE